MLAHFTFTFSMQIANKEERCVACADANLNYTIVLMGMHFVT